MSHEDISYITQFSYGQNTSISYVTKKKLIKN